jgi:hypothetical protein
LGCWFYEFQTTKSHCGFINLNAAYSYEHLQQRTPTNKLIALVLEDLVGKGYSVATVPTVER